MGITIPKNAHAFEAPFIFSSRPPFDNGWYWTIEPEDDNNTLTRQPVMCGSIVTLVNPTVEHYLSTKPGSNGIEAVAVGHKHEASDQWLLVCKNNTIWTQDEPIQLINVKNKCYLSTNLYEKIPDSANKYVVKCGPLNDETVWYASEGIYYKDPEVNTRSQEEEL